MADSEALKILAGLWGSAGDRTDPDDSSLTPALTRTVGWPSSFSSAAGNTPRRRVANQLFREVQGAATDSMRYGGVFPYDALVDYHQYGHCFIATDEFVANVANGPATTVVSPSDSGQTTWTRVAGESNNPSSPSTPTGVATNGQIVWSWNCPLDGGEAITHFVFEWRASGGTYATVTPNPTLPRYVLTGLTNGTTYQARVTAVNANGSSSPSSEGSASPAAAVPSGGALLALRAVTGDATREVDLSWLEPDSGGAAITGYTYQWRTSGQSFSSSRQGTTTSTSATVSSLTNNTEYFFQVRARNSVGSSAWSNQDRATPEAPDVPPPPPPADTVPTGTSVPTGTPRLSLVIDWSWDLVTSDGGAPITNYDFQWRVRGAGWFGNITRVNETCFRTTAPDANNDIEARVLAINSVGSGPWSSPGRATPMAIIVPPMPPADTVPMWSTGDAPSGTAAVEAIFWEWPTPDAGGERMTGYQLQWRVQGTGWSGNIVSLTNGCYLQSGLSATTTYEARVRATNSVGTGAWSDEGDATPDAEVVPPMPPADTVPVWPSPTPSPSGDVLGLSVLWQWSVPEDGGERITSYDFQWRIQGAGWVAANIISVTEGCHLLQGLSAGTTYEARIRAINSVGTGGWSGIGSATVSSLGSFYERTTAGMESFSWPWATSRARITMRGGDGGAGGGGGGGAETTRGHDGDGGGDGQGGAGAVSLGSLLGAGGPGGSGTEASSSNSMVITGILAGATLAISVGAAGSGGGGGGGGGAADGGTQASGANGVTGAQGGYVTIVPLY